jgi:hypothetical protein
MEHFDEAERFEVQVLDAGRSSWGENHPSTLIYMSNIAMVYNGQGRREEAGILITEVYNP